MAAATAGSVGKEGCKLSHPRLYNLEYDEGVGNGVRVMRYFYVVFLWGNLYVQQCDYVLLFFLLLLVCDIWVILLPFCFLLGSHCVLFI